MSTLIEPASPREVLSLLHGQLEAHFHALRAARDLVAADAPTFALEHGLADSDLVLLQTAVHESVHRGQLPRDNWLPFVVYAAEVGYDYSGEDYWPTFESRTPGWKQHGDRHYIRRKFEAFAAAFGGALPQGAWARQFSIICWPITHAVLPTDLQRQLAKLLFEYRHSLTSDMLADPALLGRRLSARSWQYSARFQNFAQSTTLLGQVASALLTGEDEHSPYLLAPTLHRLVEALSGEHESRTWLRGAKSSASRVRVHGLQPWVNNETASRRRAIERQTSTDPALLLRLTTSGWTPVVRLPELSSLAERLPELHDQLGRLRVRVTGTSGSPLPSGQLRFPGREIRLDTWPGHEAPLFQLEGGTQQANRLLADQCVLSPGPPWLFRLREPRVATEVRGRFVRPGHEYILVTGSGAGLPEGPELSPVSLACVGVSAGLLSLPEQLNEDHLELIRALQLGCLGDVMVRPVGLVPGSWDGEGFASWLFGDPVMLAIKSSRDIGSCVCTIDAIPRVLDWPEDGGEIFLQFRGLAPGTHLVEFALLPKQPGDVVARGTFSVSVETPELRPRHGTFREGLSIFASPAAPSLSELWDGRATIEVLGPVGAEASLGMRLSDRRGPLLCKNERRVVLPIHGPRWHTLAKELLRSKAMSERYDDAEICELTVTADALGSVSLICERDFAPLRWALQSAATGARLLDNTGSGPDYIERYAVQDPLTPLAVMLDDGRVNADGLLRAGLGGFDASVILPPRVQDLPSLQAALAPASVSLGPRTAAELLRLIYGNARWSEAQLPGDPVARAQRRMVLRTTTRACVVLIAGGRWRHLEERHGPTEPVPETAELALLVGEEAWQRQIGRQIVARLAEWQDLAPGKRAAEFGDVLQASAVRAGLRADVVRTGEFLLRLSSEPGTLLAWAQDEREQLLDLALVSPVLVRAARLAVLAIDSAQTVDDESTYGGWAWR